MVTGWVFYALGAVMLAATGFVAVRLTPRVSISLTGRRCPRQLTFVTSAASLCFAIGSIVLDVTRAISGEVVLGALCLLVCAAAVSLGRVAIHNRHVRAAWSDSDVITMIET